MTRALVRLTERRGEPTTDKEKRTRYGILEGWVSVLVNTGLFGVKLALGLLTGSISLIADAVHSLSDSLTSIVVIFSAKVANRPPDADHPYGHGRAESIATTTVAVLLGVAGIEFAKASVARLLSPEPVFASWWVIGVVALTALIKEWLSRFALALAGESGSTTIEADAWHHRSDVLATLLVVAAMIGGRFGVHHIDGVMGLLISAILLKVAYDIARNSIDSLLGKAPSLEEIRHLSHQAESIDGVRGVHDIVIHEYGDNRFVSLHVEVDSTMAADELHSIAERVERKVSEGRHGSVCVHVDPVNTNHPKYDEVSRVVEAVVNEDRWASSFHDLRIVGGEEEFTVLFDVVVAPECDETEAECCERLIEQILEKTDAGQVRVEVDPHYSYTVR